MHGLQHAAAPRREIVFFLPFQAVIWAGQKSLIIPTNHVKLLQRWNPVLLLDQTCYSVLHYTKLKTNDTNDCVVMILCLCSGTRLFMCFVVFPPFYMIVDAPSKIDAKWLSSVKHNHGVNGMSPLTPILLDISPMCSYSSQIWLS